MLQEALKVATKPHHDALERLMFVDEIMNKKLSPLAYEQILSTNYIVHSLLEPSIEAALGAQLSTTLKIESRLKVDALKADAIEMGLDLDALDSSVKKYYKEEFSESGALGALYVLEGATLGGNVIQKKLRKTLGFEEFGLHYYTVYQEQLMDKWLSFVQILNTSGANEEEVIAGARKTFDFIATVSKAQITSLN